MEEKTISYQKDELTVYWKPALCMHSKKCWKNLPAVFKPTEKKWIQLENASIEAIKNQVDQCPSGALSYNKNQSQMHEEKKELEISISKNGPILIDGNVRIATANGEIIKKSKVALCRCGASNNKPFCDGQHNKVGFKA